ncbi:MAG: hypothetical protein Q9160_000556 [Pyrenula sp. 1 TL-2023]
MPNRTEAGKPPPALIDIANASDLNYVEINEEEEAEESVPLHRVNSRRFDTPRDTSENRKEDSSTSPTKSSGFAAQLTERIKNVNPSRLFASKQVQHLDKTPQAMPTDVPRPGPAKLKRNAGLDQWLEAAKNCKYLSEAHMKELCEKVKELLMEESNIQPVATPVTICGDIHGQFYDLLELFRVAGGMPGDTAPQAPVTPKKIISSADIEPPSTITDPKLKKKLKIGPGQSEDSSEVSDSGELESGEQSEMDDPEAVVRQGSGNFIFLGDYVDRGYFSLETLTLLLCLKAKYPNKITLVRGNHESRQITQVYGFYEECVQKYGNTSVWKACCQVFDFMILGAIIDGKVLCVHGGLSPEIRTLDQVRVVARAQEIPHEGAFCDIVWSDPEDVETWAVSPRGAGWLFGDKVATEFCHVNNLSLIARAHQLVNEGYKYHFKDQSVVTVWSAPNYCYRCGNMASVCEVGEDLKPNFKLFSAVKDEMRCVPPTRPGRNEYFL